MNCGSSFVISNLLNRHSGSGEQEVAAGGIVIMKNCSDNQVPPRFDLVEIHAGKSVYQEVICQPAKKNLKAK